MAKKKNRRQLEQNSAVNPQLNLKSRYEELEDINEYFHTLPPDAQKWMNSYTDNFVNASFNKKEDENLINLEFTKSLLKKYVKELKNNNVNERKVKAFVKKYLIRTDNIPLKIIKELFFEKNAKKQLKLIDQLRDSILNNIKKTKKRELNKIIKIIQKEVYGVNNSRNRCILTREKAGGSLSYLEELTENEQMNSSEDNMISNIDLKNKLQDFENGKNRGDGGSEKS